MAGHVYSHFDATDHMVSRVHIHRYFAYTCMADADCRLFSLIIRLTVFAV